MSIKGIILDPSMYPRIILKLFLSNKKEVELTVQQNKSLFVKACTEQVL